MKKFLWGFANASFQSDGKLGDSDWSEWLKEHAKLDQYLASSPNLYANYKELIAVMKEEGVNAYRFSIDWSLIMPTEESFDQAILDHYKSFLQALHEAEITPIATLHHFVHPRWFMNNGGWEKASNIQYFLKFVEKVVTEFKEDISIWLTINEPTIYVNFSYIQGTRPPYKKNIFKGYLVMLNMLRAHNAAYSLIHSIDKRKSVLVGMANAIWPIINPRTTTKGPILTLANFVSNNIPFVVSVRYSDILGLNYYGVFPINLRYVVLNMLGLKTLAHKEQQISKLQQNKFNWWISPENFKLVIQSLYKYNKPIIITENGTFDTDKNRETFIKDHIEVILKERKEHPNLIGYLHWTFVDNYEWDFGYEYAFGTHHYDKKTNSFESRNSGRVYADIMKSNKII